MEKYEKISDQSWQMAMEASQSDDKFSHLLSLSILTTRENFCVVVNFPSLMAKKLSTKTKFNDEKSDFPFDH